MRSGNNSLSPPLFDSDLDDVPERGLLSEGSTLYLELTADSSSIPLLLALRYEGEHGHVIQCILIFEIKKEKKNYFRLSFIPLTRFQSF